MSIDLGQEQIQQTVQNSLVLKDLRIIGLDTPASKMMVITYVLNRSGVIKEGTIQITDQDWNDFYLNTWHDGKAITDKIYDVENLGTSIDVLTAEQQFLNS